MSNLCKTMQKLKPFLLYTFQVWLSTCVISICIEGLLSWIFGGEVFSIAFAKSFYEFVNTDKYLEMLVVSLGLAWYNLRRKNI
jgi:hypothetical protein